VIVNAGKAKIDGAELALHYRPTRQWTLDASYSHLDGKLTEDAPGLGHSGAPLPNSPKDSFMAGANYGFEAAGYRFQAGGDVRYVGSRNAGFEGSSTLPNYKLPDYTTVNLHATADFRVAQVTLFVRNVADKHGQLGAGTNFIPLGGYAQVTPLEPRTVGLSVSGTF
jgi:outer membrane receptor protein involved in Fe transport